MAGDGAPRFAGPAGTSASPAANEPERATMNATNRPADDKPRVHELKEMLQYQEKSIVSRMLAKNAGGSVTLFAFDSGEGLSEHTAPFDALVIAVDGTADISIAGEPYSVSAGQTLLLPAGIPHAVAPVGRFKMLLVMIRSELHAHA